MAEECTCGGGDMLIFPCSGGSNCGQIANQVAVGLTEEGLGDISCLAGVGAHIDDFVEKAKAAQRVFAIDGCGIACAKKTLEHAGVPVTHYLDVSREGIVKCHDFGIRQQDMLYIIKMAKQRLTGDSGGNDIG